MDWFAPVDIYCERTNAVLWSEPLNAVSNVGFLIAAGAAAFKADRLGPSGTDGPVLLLSALVGIIGIGSFLFHTLANRWSLLADVIPIGIFILAYLFLALRRFFRLPGLWSGLIVAGFFVASQAVEELVPRSFLNGSGGYIPAWTALIVIAALLWRRDEQPAARYVLGSAGVFTASLTFRSLDHAVCEMLPIGVHYMWHMLNALTLYILLAAALQYRVSSELHERASRISWLRHRF
jgi:hypothetical protein